MCRFELISIADYVKRKTRINRTHISNICPTTSIINFHSSKKSPWKRFSKKHNSK